MKLRYNIFRNKIFYEKGGIPINELLAQVFERRGYTKEFLTSINTFKEQKLDDIDELCEALHDIKLSKEQIIVLPDYDMDGIMSGVIAYTGLADLGFNVDIYVPDVSLGYGFNKDVIDLIISRFPNVKHIITCDNGIQCFDGVTYAKSKNIDVYITDHHMSSTTFPEAEVIVNPNKFGSTYEHPEICGAVVIWKVLMHYVEKYKCDTFVSQRIDRLRVFAGISTVSDMMPILYENRVILKDSLIISNILLNSDVEIYLENSRRPLDRAFKNYKILLRRYRDEYKKIGDEVNEDFYAFYLAPTFNSVKRLAEDMKFAFGLFLAKDPDKFITKLHDLNEERKDLVKKYLSELTPLDNSSIYVYFTDAQPGLLGLLANSVMSTTGLPTFVLNYSSLSGSGRSPYWFSSITNLQDFTILGHECAFGCSFKDIDEVERLNEAVDLKVKEIIKESEDSPQDNSDIYDYEIFTVSEDGLFTPASLYYDFCKELKVYEPFGQGFTKPVGLLHVDMKYVSYQVMGSESQHLKLILPKGVEVLLFNQADLLEDLIKREVFDVEGSLQISEFMGNERVQFNGKVLC